MELKIINGMRESAKKHPDQVIIDPLDELISYVDLDQQSKASKKKMEKIEAYFNEIGEPLKKLLPKVVEDLQQYFTGELRDKNKVGCPMAVDKKEGRYYKRVKKTEPGSDFEYSEMEFRSPKAAIAYLNKRRHPSHLKNLSFHPDHGENVILHETSFESNKSGIFIWCFVNPDDPASALNVFFSDEWTARKHATKNGFKIVDETGSYQSEDKTIEENEKTPKVNSSFVFSLHQIRPIPNNNGCTEVTEGQLQFSGKPCLDDEIRSAKKRAIDQKSKFVDLHDETIEKADSSIIPHIAERVVCERLLQSRSYLIKKISELQIQLQQTEAVLGLFGQNTEEYAREYGKMLYDYYDERLGGSKSNYDEIIAIHAKLERAKNKFAHLVTPSFNPRPGQKVRIFEAVSPLELPISEYGHITDTMKYCFVDPNSPGKFQPVFFKHMYDIQREAFIKNYIIVDEEGFEVLNPFTYEVYVLEEFISMHSIYN